MPRDAEIAELKLSHGPAEVTQWAFLDRSTNVGKMWENLKENPSQNALRGVFRGASGTTFEESIINDIMLIGWFSICFNITLSNSLQ